MKLLAPNEKVSNKSPSHCPPSKPKTPTIPNSITPIIHPPPISYIHLNGSSFYPSSQTYIKTFQRTRDGEDEGDAESFQLHVATIS